MNHILIAGGAGFIGTHLCKQLLGAGHRVTVIDNFLTGIEANLAQWRDHPRFQLLYHDIATPLPKTYHSDFNQIYNLACPASPTHYQRDPVRTLLINIVGTQHLLELARHAGARFLQASTSEVYGDPIQHPQREDYYGNVNPIGIRACYDEGKRSAETLCFDYHREYGTDIRVARIFNTYGPHMRRDDGRVISNFICQALEGVPITMYGDGMQTRSFCYIDDMVDGIIRSMDYAGAFTGPVNLGNPEEVTMEALAEHIMDITGSESAIAYQPLPQDDPARRRPDITLARTLLGWEPATSMERGLQRTVAHFRQVLGK